MKHAIGLKPVDIEWADGDPKTGVIIKVNPTRPDRVWPNWSIRPHLNDYPLMAQRFDNGGPITDASAKEAASFFAKTHVHVGHGVYVMEVKENNVRFFPSVYSEFARQGHFARWLDSLDPADAIGFPEVVDIRLAQILHRRGFQLVAINDDDAAENDWLPVHFRNGKD